MEVPSVSESIQQLDFLQSSQRPQGKTGGGVIPFGKYKGEPVEVLLADRSYCDWLASQPWLRERYGNVYQTIINYGGEPQDSPEHNELQLAFLDDEWCLRLAGLVWPKRNFGRLGAQYPSVEAELHGRFREHFDVSYDEAPMIIGRSFEARGWDVGYAVDPIGFSLVTKSLPDCICECDHSGCPAASPREGEEHCSASPCRCSCDRGHQEWRCRHATHRRTYPRPLDHCTDGCPWAESIQVSESGWSRWLHLAEWFPAPKRYDQATTGRILVECKPDLGDDFPSVLRQMKSYDWESDSRPVLLVRRYGFERVTWDQVVKMFAESKIKVLLESEVSAAPVPVS